jgi:hypothetical protein
VTVERTREVLPGGDAERTLNDLIERRTEEQAEQERVEASRAESMRTYNLAAAAERRRQWADYHQGLARLHTRLAAEHEEKALRLTMDGA